MILINQSINQLNQVSILISNQSQNRLVNSYLRDLYFGPQGNSHSNIHLRNTLPIDIEKEGAEE